MQIAINDNIILKLGQRYEELENLRQDKSLKYVELFNARNIIMGVILDKIVELTFHNNVLTYIKINGMQEFNRISFNDLMYDIDEIKCEADRILSEDTKIKSVDTVRNKLVLSNDLGYNATLMAFDKNNLLIKTLNNSKDEY